uniref:Uncharacterized protein n=1 Tax=Romanomermis culicivorax TaxID=13658 RepID=A0A915I6K6_ROMCU
MALTLLIISCIMTGCMPLAKARRRYKDLDENSTNNTALGVEQKKLDQEQIIPETSEMERIEITIEDSLIIILYDKSIPRIMNNPGLPSSGSVIFINFWLPGTCLKSNT